MRLLRVLGLVFVNPGCVGHIGRAKPPFDLIARFSHRLGGHINAVGAHIGDMPGLIKPLRR